MTAFPRSHIEKWLVENGRLDIITMRLNRQAVGQAGANLMTGRVPAFETVIDDAKREAARAAFIAEAALQAIDALDPAHFPELELELTPRGLGDPARVLKFELPYGPEPSTVAPQLAVWGGIQNEGPVPLELGIGSGPRLILEPGKRYEPLDGFAGMVLVKAQTPPPASATAPTEAAIVALQLGARQMAKLAIAGERLAAFVRATYVRALSIGEDARQERESVAAWEQALRDAGL